MKRILTAILLFGALTVSACQQESQPNSTAPATATPSSAPFRIAFNTWIGYSPLVIAKEKGFLKEAGIDANISILEGIGEKNSALIRGDIDGVGHTADSAVTSVASGVDGQIVYVFDRSLGADGILAKKRIRTISDLKGQKVALEPGFTGHFFFLYLLDEAGLKPEDVQVIPMDTGSAGSAFVAGKVEAAVTWEPWIGKSKSLSDAHVLVTSADKPGVIIDVLFMNRSTIEKRRDDVRKLVVAMGRATDWYGQNVNEGDDIIAKFWKLKLEEEKETVAGMKFMPLSENAAFFGSATAPGQLLTVVTKANDLWLKTGVIKKPVQPERLIDFATVNAAATAAK
jgi:NitT/TauT family transport system substrate-binding protein